MTLTRVGTLRSNTQGYEVHVIDNVERGRAGFAPGLWEGDAMLRSLEEAWALFRIGTVEGFANRTPFDGQRFPVSHFDTFAQIFVPRWLSTTHLHVEALCAVLERTGPAIVICHSQGGEITFDAYSRADHLIEHIIALEPSGHPEDSLSLQDSKLTICAGDNLDHEPQWQARQAAWAALGKTGPKANYVQSAQIGGGNSHMLMMDDNSAELFEVVMAK